MKILDNKFLPGFPIFEETRMIGKKIKYKCANCGWEASILAEWSDLKPKRCANKRCNTSFQAYPEKLVTELPEGLKEKKTVKSRKKPAEDSSKKKELAEKRQKRQEKKADNEQKDTDSKEKSSSETKQQSSGSEKEPKEE